MEYMIDPFEMPNAVPDARDTVPNLKDEEDNNRLSTHITNEIQTLSTQLSQLEEDFIELHRKLKSTYTALQDIIVTADSVSAAFRENVK